MAVTSTPSTVINNIAAQTGSLPRAAGDKLINPIVQNGKLGGLVKRKVEDELQNSLIEANMVSADGAVELAGIQDGPILLAQAETGAGAAGGGAAASGGAAAGGAGAASGTGLSSVLGTVAGVTVTTGGALAVGAVALAVVVAGDDGGGTPAETLTIISGFDASHSFSDGDVTLGAVTIAGGVFANLDIDNDSSTTTLGAVTILAGVVAGLEINGNYASDAATTITLDAVTMAGEDTYLNINDNGAWDAGTTTITLGAVTMAGEDTNLGINGNGASDATTTITLGAVTMAAGYNAQLEINNNSSFSDGSVEITMLGVTLEGGDARLRIVNNSDAAIELGAVSLTTDGGNADLDITNNDGSIITLASISLASLYSGALLEIEYNNDAEITVTGDVTLSSFYSGAELRISDNDGSTITLGVVSLTASDSVYLNISDNDDTNITLGNVTLTSIYSDADLWINNNDSNGNVITLGNVVMNAGWDADVNIGDLSANGGTAIDIGTLTVTASDDIDVIIYNYDTLTGLETVSLTGGNFSDSFVNVYIDGAEDMVTLTVAGTITNIELDNLGDSGSAFATLDLSGVTSDANVYMSDADFNGGAGVTINIGNSDLYYENDLVGDGSKEVFQFVGDDIGSIVISDFVAGQGDSLDFSQFAGVDNIDDLTYTEVGDDVVIEFDNVEYGSITLTGAGVLLSIADLASIVII